MAKYKIWDKTSPIYTLTGKVFTAEEWLAQHAWAGIEGVKMIIGGGVINGTVAMEFEATKEFYARKGCEFAENMSDEEILATIEEFENKPKEPSEPTTEERTAAALEFIALNSLPDEEETI